MRKAGRKWGSKSVFHYIIAYSIVMVLIFAAMGGYLYQYYYRTIYNDFQAANQSETEHIASMHENEVQSINSIVLQMSLDTDITHFKLEEEPEKSLKLEDRLYQYKIANQFFDSVFYCYHEDHYVYNQTTSLEIDFLLEKGLGLEESGREVLRSCLYDSGNGLKILPEQKASGYLQGNYPASGKTVIYLVPVVPYNMGTMAFTVNEYYYNELLGSDASELRSNYILYGGQVIVSRGVLEIEEEQIANWVGEGRSGSEQVELNGKKYLLTCEQGKSGILYCQVQDMELFRKKVFSGQWGILLLLLLCSVPLSLLIIKISRSISRSVRKWNVLLNHGAEDYYNLDSIESGIQLLTQSSMEAARESESYKKSDFVRGFVRNDYTKETLYAAAADAGFSISGRIFLVALMGDRDNSNEKKAYGLMLEEIRQEEQVEGYGVRLMNSGQSMFVLFGGERETVEKTLQRMFAYGMEHCEDFIMAVSEYHSDFSEGAKAYLEADAAYDNRFLADNGEILRFSDVNISETIRRLPDNYVYELKNAVRMGNEKEVQRTVHEICGMMKRENRSLLSFRIFYNDLVNMLLTEFQGEGKELKDIYNVFTLSQCLNISDFNAILCETCRLLMTGERIGGADGNDMVDRAVRHMREHYNEPGLNMSSLAEYLGISSVTLAVNFKNGAGISPSDYLAGIRMEKARELLENTVMLVKEVSLAVGYEDERVFMRRFKKYTGYTPAQYRMKMME